MISQIETEKNNVEYLSVQIEELENNEIVKKYTSLLQQRNKSNDSINLLNSEIKKIEREECSEYGHPVLFCLGISRDNYEGRSYYCCKCLNCGEKIEVPKGNMKSSQIIDCRIDIEKTNNFFINMHQMLEQATAECHLLQECYYRYPEILQEKDKKSKMIYKVMKKRYEIKK